MHQYDPERAPNPEEWLALDEQERIILSSRPDSACSLPCHS
jgi:hypothetical protein